MDVDRFKVLIAAYHIDRRHVLYLRTANPVHFWSAYWTARQLKVAVPAWVLDCFDTWAPVLTSETHRSAKALADALKIGKRGGATVTRKAAGQLRDLEIVVDVLDLHDHPTRSDEMVALAKKHGITVDDVVRVDNQITLIMDHVAGERGLEYGSVAKKYYKLIRRRRVPAKRPKRPAKPPAKRFY